ncbi:hypothetical protein BDZ88DRAFT_440220 [Geranomyces variabilis]|nr:hypothetical protein BDZ88DRAFT_440220 [Geranomyces variabilis]KAJ3132025.1 hypothetical protein HDU90_007576 [Geranomyces variabilis]
MSDLYAFPDILNQVLNSVPTEDTDWKPFYIKAFERQRADIVRGLISTKRTIELEKVVLIDLMAHAVRIGRRLDVLQAFAAELIWPGHTRHWFLDIVANRDPNIFWLPGRRCDPETIVNYYASDPLIHGWIGGVRHLVLTGAVEDNLVTTGFHERLPQDHLAVVRAIRKPDMTPQQWLDVLEPCFELVLEGLRSEDADTDEFGVIFPEKYL